MPRSKSHRRAEAARRILVDRVPADLKRPVKDAAEGTLSNRVNNAMFVLMCNLVNRDREMVVTCFDHFCLSAIMFI